MSTLSLRQKLYSGIGLHTWLFGMPIVSAFASSWCALVDVEGHVKAAIDELVTHVLAGYHRFID